MLVNSKKPKLYLIGSARRNKATYGNKATYVKVSSLLDKYIYKYLINICCYS